MTDSTAPEVAAMSTGATMVRTLISLVLVSLIWTHVFYLVPVYESIMASAGITMSGVSVVAVRMGHFFGGLALGLGVGLLWLGWKARRGPADAARFAAAHGITNLLLVLYLAMVSMVYVDFARSVPRIQQGGSPPPASPSAP